MAFQDKRKHLSSMRPLALAALLSVALTLGMPGSATAKAPLNPGVEAGKLGISGMGAMPNSRVTMQLTPQLTLTAVANNSGAFTFTPIPYDFISDLAMNFTIQLSDTKKSTLQNTLLLRIKPTAFNVDAEGTATKAASIALNVGGEAAATGVANSSAFFRISSPAKFSSMKSENTKIIASIINVTEECCPRILKPTEPVTILVQNLISAPRPAPAVSASVPLVIPAQPPVAPAASPSTPAAEPKIDKTPKPGTPVGPRTRAATGEEKSGELQYGEVTHTATLHISTGAYAGSVDSTWVADLRKISTSLVQAMMMEARMIGGFIDAQAALDAQRALQRLQAKALKDYTPGEALCGFGTLSRSLAASEGRSLATQKAINEVMIDRESLRLFTDSAQSAQDGQTARMSQFLNTFCSRVDEGNALDRFCDNAVTDTNLNRDVDYTRVIDTPLTLDVNFITAPSAAQQRNNTTLLALSKNLFANEAISGFGANEFQSGKLVTDDLQDMRNVTASRGVVRNSFAALVGMKAAGTAGSVTYMRNILTQMGLPAADATKLIGENPSYFAQMEILTKRIYQDPRFFAELYDKPANVDRQRAAMRGINLTQQNDYLDVLHRREMLLSVLLELKLQNLDRKASGN